MAGRISDFIEAWKSIAIGHNITMQKVLNKRVRRVPMPTLDYPHEKPELAERFRGAPMVHRIAGETDEKEGSCTGCGLCAKACPVNCITVERDKDKESPLKVAKWTLDLTKCMFCGLCEEACTQGALRMSHDYENSEYTKDKLIYELEEVLRRPVEIRRSPEPVGATASTPVSEES